MKRCPTCQRSYTEDSQKFCAQDGTPLVSDDQPDFDPEATVMSSVSRLRDEAPSSPVPPQGSSATGYQPEQNVPQPAPPQAPGNAPPAAGWPPAAPQPQQPPAFYPQAGAPGGQPAPPWPGGQPQQTPNWSPGQPIPPQGQGMVGGGYYPQQPGQYAPQARGSSALGILSLITGLISFFNWAYIFSMYFRIIAPDRSVAEVVVYVALIPGILAVLLGLISLFSSRWRNKWLSIVGMLLGLPGIIFFIYLAAEGRLP